MMWVLVLCWVMAVALANPSCPESKPGMLNVHLVCHTHDDVGWLKTVDQYYYGAKNYIQMAGVQYVLDSVVQALLRDPAKKFIYVESAFFFRWWDEQTPDMQADVKGLVARGQLEFIGGGWCMNDEAAAHYNAIVDQMTLGLAKLNDTFGIAGRPTIAWQIDPFGHSREQASLFAQMGFEGLFFGRLDHDDKSNRWKHKTMEMVWEASPNLGRAAWLFTGVLPNGYGPPNGFCFDINCRDEPIMDDPRLKDYNVDQKVDAFLREAWAQATGYATDHIVMTMGEDFNYQSADMWYNNLDKLIRYVNARQTNGSKVNVFYSTPSCYLDALHRANLEWTSKTDDFFPYASGNHSYWTGYFTSRPTLKGFVRKANNFLQAVKQVSSTMGLGQDSRLEQLKEAMGVLQHHDAVSGTAKQHVTDDYSERLADGVATSFQMLTEAYSKLQGEPASNSSPMLCPLVNVSSCPVSEGAESFVVTVYNPLARPRTHHIRLPVPSGYGYKVKDNTGDSVLVQLVPVPEEVLKVPGRNSTATMDLVFEARDIPPLGYLQFHVQRTANRRVLMEQTSSVHPPTMGHQDILASLGVGSLAVLLDKDTGLLKSIGVVRPDGITMIKVNQTYLWYAGMSGDNSKEEKRASGAYIFRPDGDQARPVATKANITLVQGPLVAEIHQVWTPWVSQVLRVYKHQLTLEMEWLVGPIPIADGIGKEVVNRVIWRDVSTNNTFFTDANGREIIKRVKDHRDTWTLHNLEPVAGNYYPVNSRLIVSAGPDFQGALLNDRSQGGTSLDDGHMELMVHRRLLHDDAFGVGEALNETAFGEGLVARGKHFLLHSYFASDDCDFACLHRSLAERVMLEPITSVTPSDNYLSWRNRINKKWSALTQSLPDNVHLLTLEPWGNNAFLLRLEHMYERGESKVYSQPASVDLKGLLLDWEIVSAVEMTLAANMEKSDLHRYDWNVNSASRHSNTLHSFESDAQSSPMDDLVVLLQPMEIRTFILNVNKAT